MLVWGWHAGLADKAHVIKVGADTLYTAVLGLVDITRGTNSFYKLQALEGDQGNRFAWMGGSSAVCGLLSVLLLLNRVRSL